MTSGDGGSSGLSRMWMQRLRRQLLSGPPARSVDAVVDHLLAVQAQDPRGARLAIRARSTVRRAAEVDRALDSGRLVVSWLNRGTLHLVCSEDYWWLHSLTTPQLATSNATRLRQEGVESAAADRGVDAIVAALDSDGPLIRAQLRERVAAAGVPTEGQALVHLLVLASIRGLIVRGPMQGREQAFVLVRDWLGTSPAVDRDVALAELARRYLRGHGPAGERDLAKWAGIPLRAARAALAAIAAELATRDDGLAVLRRSRVPDDVDAPPPLLLGSFEPSLLGWTSRDEVLRMPAARRLVTANGLFRSFALVDGRAVATWSLGRQGIEITPFEPLPEPVTTALDDQAAKVREFLVA